jgi:acyl-CoA synthetase (AMP-forming)/AMP-acid ligase II
MFDHFTAHLSPGAWPAPLERLISAGARLETSTVRAFHGSFGLKIHSFYGTSETGGIAYDDAADIEEETTVGRPMPGVRIALLPEEGAPEGGGRVHVAGDAVASGYAGGDPFSPPEAGGGFLTGDVGRFTARGHLVLSGRVSSFINVAGRKVQPEEVEAVLRSMPGIDDARVVGAPHPTRGQQIVACIVARGGDPGALAVRQYCGGAADAAQDSTHRNRDGSHTVDRAREDGPAADRGGCGRPPAGNARVRCVIVPGSLSPGRGGSGRLPAVGPWRDHRSVLR